MGDISDHVAAHATTRNAVNTRKLTLLGVVTTPGERSALVRLPSGRVRKVTVGDALKGGRVTAIGSAELHYRKANRTRILALPA